MKTISTTVVALSGLALLAACSPEQMESAPVTVQSAQGPVTCQLYTRSQVTWDRAIGHPGTMDVRTADELCRAEGRRLMNAPVAAAAPVEVVTPAGNAVVVESGL